MAATIITSFSGGFEYEPEIISDNARDGITAFQFRIVGSVDALNNAYTIGSQVFDVPDQPDGNFFVVRRNLECIVGGENNLYRLSVSAEGGKPDQSLFISENSYAMQNQQVSGLVNLPRVQIPIQYKLIWLYPTGTITTNAESRGGDVGILGDGSNPAEEMAKKLVESMPITIIKDRPKYPNGNVSGPSLEGNKELDKVYITGSSLEKAGGLYRARATASKGLFLEEQ